MFGKKQEFDFFSTGIEKYERELYDGAIIDFSTAINLVPENAEAWLWRGKSFYAKKMYGRAAVDFTEAIRLEKLDKTLLSDCYFLRGICKQYSDQFAAAITDFESALVFTPEIGNIYFSIARSYIFMEDWDKTITACSKSMELQTAPPAGLYQMRARAYAKLNKNAEAIADYTQALVIDNTFVHFWVERAVIYSTLGNHEQCLSDYDSGLKIAPTMISALVGRAQTLNDLERHQEAFDSATKAMELYFSVESEQNDLSQTDAVRVLTKNLVWLYDHDEYLQIEKCAQQILQIEPENYFGNQLLGEMSFLKKDYPTAHEYLHAAELADPEKKDFDSAYMLAVCHNEFNAGDHAIAYFTEAIERKKPNIEGRFLSEKLYYERARANWRIYCGTDERKRLDNVFADCNAQLRETPDDAESHYLRGLCLGELGCLEQAKADLLRAAELFKKENSEVGVCQSKNELGNLLAKNGEYSDAIALFSEVLATFNEYDVLMARGLAYFKLGELAKARIDYLAAIDVEPEKVVEWYGDIVPTKSAEPPIH